MTRLRLVGAIAALGLLVAGCGGAGSTSSAPTSASPSAPAGAGQPVHVLYAGSLVNLMEKDLGPKFAAGP
jgi:ABC-type molybdate transport system substrate-binding protein